MISVRPIVGVQTIWGRGPGWWAICALVCSTAACTKSTPDPVVSVQGNATLHPLAALMGAANGLGTTGLTIKVFDGAALVSDPKVPALGSADVGTADCGKLDALGRPLDPGCAFSANKLDVKGAVLGLLAITDDAEGSDDFIPTATGVATGDTVQGAKPGDVLTAPTPVEAFSRDALAKLGQFLAGTRGETLSADELACRGVVLGALVDEQSQPAPGARVGLAFADARVQVVDLASALGADQLPGTADDQPQRLLSGELTDLTGLYVVLPDGSGSGPCDPSSQVPSLGQLVATDGVRSWIDTFPILPGKVVVRFVPPLNAPRLGEPLPKITVDGYAMMHPVIALLGEAPTLQGRPVQLGLTDPRALLTGADPVASATVTTTGCNQLSPMGQPIDPGCAVSVADVPLATLGLGLLAVVDDGPGHDDLVPALTGVASTRTIDACQGGDRLDAPAPLDALTKTAEGTLSALVGGMRGQMWAPGELTCRSFAVGTVLDRTLQPAAGAVLGVAGTAATVYYVNVAAALGPDGMPGTADDRPDLVLSGAATDATGTYLVVPELSSGQTCTAGARQPTSARLTGASGALTWSDDFLLLPGAVTLQFLAPQDQPSEKGCQVQP